MNAPGVIISGLAESGRMMTEDGIRQTGQAPIFWDLHSWQSETACAQKHEDEAEIKWQLRSAKVERVADFQNIVRQTGIEAIAYRDA